jgi:hypothetical protein
MKEAKTLEYTNKIKKSWNQNKTVWGIVNLEINKPGNTEKINNLNIDGNLISNHQEITLFPFTI